VAVDDDYLPDEFVLDAESDAPPSPPRHVRRADIVFAGPSDPPPPSTMRSANRPSASPWRGRYPLAGFALMAAAGLALVARTQFASMDDDARGASAPVVRSAVAEPHPEATAAGGPVGSPSANVASMPAPPAGSAAPAAPPADSPEAPQNADPPEVAAGVAKRAAQAALEDGLTAQAVYAGERSVALDPGDAEAWLILGAAYQQRRAWPDARRCFKSCVDLATRGPRGECAALLR
jgi:hypothetical protein